MAPRTAITRGPLQVFRRVSGRRAARSSPVTNRTRFCLPPAQATPSQPPWSRGARSPAAMVPAVRTTARAAALLLLGTAAFSVAANAVNAGADQRRLSDLSVADVQGLLQKHNLAPFLAEEFGDFLIDGAALRVLREDSVSADDFPRAKRFHWDKLFKLLDGWKQDEDSAAAAVSAATAPADKASGGSSPRAGQRRNLAGSDDFSGIHVKKDAAALVLGVDGDVGLRRTGEAELSLMGRLLVANSTGDMLDVAEQLEDLLAAAAEASADERLDVLTEMVALNTELLMNVSLVCEAAGSGAATEAAAALPLYTCVDALVMEADSGRFLTEDYGYVLCNNDYSVGGWTLAMNIDTSDGNVVDYNNQAFWEDATTLGGATKNINYALTADYKNNAVFSGLPAGHILVVVHEEGEMLGWRAWSMLDTTQPLSYYFQGGADSTNICGTSMDDQETLTPNSYVPMTAFTFDADDGEGELSSMEPLVYMDDCQLFANLDVAGSNDYNRLTCASHPELNVTGNFGYGLGTLYDARHGSNGESLSAGVCPSGTMRPLCDAQLHVTTGNWGSAGGTGGMIGTDNDCNGGCPWTVQSGFNYDYAIYVREAQEVAYDDCDQALEDDAPTGAYLLSSGEWAYCNMDISGGGWSLALNIDTSDGNVVDYQNTGFWESETELGGAHDYPVNPFAYDYKNPHVFSEFQANEILVVLHKQGKTVLGYRAWTLYTPGQPLVEYFTDENSCGTASSPVALGEGKFNYVTSAVIDASVGDDVISEEPLIYNDDYQLYANVETGESHDYNRLTAKAHPEIGASGNYGWGLGTLYDSTSESTTEQCPTTSARPLCDAQFHSTGSNWGTNGGVGGMIGTDNVCNKNDDGDSCPWTTESGYEWDYAIYVRKAEPVYYASCAAVAAAGGVSGQYMLSNNKRVYCYIDDDGAGWLLAANIATSDGHVVHYSNVDFWESDSKLGGASEHHATPFQQDYKNTYAFGTFEATKMLIVVHEQGVGAQEDSLGWRSWNLTAKQPLVDYFTGTNKCGTGITSSGLGGGGSGVTMTAGVIDGAVYDLNSMEPMVYHGSYEVYANIENGNSEDYNRMSAKASKTQTDPNKGWGLGTLYDATHGSTTVCGPNNAATTARPQCDAQFHALGGNWGTTSGTGGQIGTDDVCFSDCPWTTPSGITYDYAIFVM